MRFILIFLVDFGLSFPSDGVIEQSRDKRSVLSKINLAK